MSITVKILDKFGKTYIDFVRNTVLRDMLELTEGDSKFTTPSIQRLIGSLSDENKSTLIEFTSEAIDKCLHYTLFMLEEYQDEMQLLVKDDTGRQYSLLDISDGLCGELYTEDGWIAKYSKYPSWQLGEKIEPQDNQE